MLQHKNSGQDRAIRGHVHSFAVPGSAVHTHLVFLVLPSTLPLVILSGVTGRQSRGVTESKDPYTLSWFVPWIGPLPTRLVPAHDNPVIAQYFDILNRSPQASTCTLSCHGMPDEQIRIAICADNPSTVQFDRLLLREAVHKQQFVEGILERFCIPREIQERLPIHLQRSRIKTVIYAEPLVGLTPKPWRYEIKLETVFGLKGFPSGSRVKHRKPWFTVEHIGPSHAHPEVGRCILHPKRLQRRKQRDIDFAISTQPDGDTTNLKLAVVADLAGGRKLASRSKVCHR